MATLKITAAELKQAAALGITAKDAEGVKKQLLKKLKENEVEGVEDESISELLEMYGAFHEVEEEEEEEETEEEEVEQLADEAEEEEEDLDEEEEEDLDEEEEEEEAPKKSAKKAAPAPAAKTVAKKVAAPAAKKEAPKKSSKFTPWTSDDKANKKAIQAIIDCFPDAEIKWLKQGITVFFVGKSSKKAIISFDRLKIVDGEVVGDLFFNALKGKEEVHQHVGEDKDFKNFNSNLLFLSKLTVEEAVEILEEDGLIDHMTKTLANADKRAVANRVKLEDKIAGEKGIATSKNKVAAKAKAVVEEEEEEEEEEEAPKKVVKKVATPVKTAKKVVVEEEEEEEEEEEVVVKKKPVVKKR